MIEQSSILSIGILAHNEQSHIEVALRSLFTQDVFSKYSTEVIVVANGCTDNTAALALKSLADHRQVWLNSGSARVEEVIIAGKANAWNSFVHKFSAVPASILILMDADITFLNNDTISSMVMTLGQNEQAVVCVDRPVKDIELRFNHSRTFFQRLLVAATPAIDLNDVPLCGQLYCAYSADLRAIRLPTQISVEDGMIRALLLTHGFTRPENVKRIAIDARVSHSFASVATFAQLFNHEKWIVSGSIINMLLFARFGKECTVNKNAMALMASWEKADPNWIVHYIKSEVDRRGWRLLPPFWWSRRFSRLRHLHLAAKVRRFPVALIATLLDGLIFLAAIRDVRCGRAFGYWR